MKREKRRRRGAGSEGRERAEKRGVRVKGKAGRRFGVLRLRQGKEG